MPGPSTRHGRQIARRTRSPGCAVALQWTIIRRVLPLNQAGLAEFFVKPMTTRVAFRFPRKLENDSLQPPS
jgi:hypothetical protein